MGICKQCGKQVQLDEAKYYGEYAYSPCHDRVLITPDQYQKVLAAKERKNRAQRGRYTAMRSLGMTKTPYGWE